MNREWWSKTGSRFVKGAKILKRTAILSAGAFLVYHYVHFNRTQKKILSVPNNSVLLWKFDKVGFKVDSLQKLNITESRPEGKGVLPLSLAIHWGEVTFLEVLNTLQWAKEDDRVTGLVLDLSTSGAGKSQLTHLGLAQLQELRDAIIQFGKVKRQKFGEKTKLIAYTDSFDFQWQYYLASAFDDIQMEPIGFLPLNGIGTRQLFFKSLLEKVGIRFQAAHGGDYKAYSTMYTETGFTKPIRENLTQLFKSLDSQFVQDIVSARREAIKRFNTPLYGMLLDGQSNEFSKLDSVAKFRKLMDVFLLSANEAAQAGLVDKVVERRPIWRQFHIDQQGNPVLSRVEGHGELITKDFNLYRLARAIEKEAEQNHLNKRTERKTSVGLVYLTGTMMRGLDDNGASRVANAIVDAGRDPDIDSILLRIDSGGGDAIAAESIWQAIKRVQEEEKKPVIANFGNVSASGAYYISAPCDRIIALPTSITGSIGVASARPHVTPELLDKLGVSVDEISFSKGFNLTSLDKEMTPEAWKRFQYRTDQVYSIFLNRVAEGRGLNIEFLKENVAGGRVWSGVDALKIGLIDEFGNERKTLIGIGGILKAIKVAGLTGWKKKINAEKDALVEKPDLINVVIYPKHKPILERLLDRTGGSVLEKVKMEMKGMIRDLILDMIHEEQVKMEQEFYFCST